MPLNTSSTGRSRSRSAPKEEGPAARLAAELPGMGNLLTLARQMRSWTDSMVTVAGPATDMAVAAAATQTEDPKRRASIQKAGAVLRRLRESAGLTMDDVAKALDLRDPALLKEAECGGAGLPFEVLLRLAAVLGRDDPMTALMRLTRAYNPELWTTLEQLGLGRLIVQAGRERELANIYRANDDARQCDDDEFARILTLTRQAFDMAIAFRMTALSRDPK